MESNRAIGAFVADRPLIAFGPGDRVEAAVAAMKEHESDCVLVCEGGALRGIFTQRDFLNRVAVVGKSDAALGEVMTANPDALGAGDGLALALNRMAVGNYRNIPVVGDGGEALAHLSVWDVMQHLSDSFASGDAELAALGSKPLAALSLRPSVEVDTGDRLLGILSLMLQRACGAVRVNDGDRLAGIFAERDLMYRVDYSTTAWHEIAVSEVMTPDPVCISRQATIAEALALMTNKRFRHLPIIDDDPDDYSKLVSIREILAFVASRKPARA